MGQFGDSWYSYQFRYCSVNNSGLLVLCVHIIELDLFPWWMITGRFERMGISESGQLWFVVAGKLVVDLGFAYIISRVPIVRKVIGYESRSVGIEG